LLCALALSLASCGGAAAPAASPAQDITNVQARLTAGPWVLTQYQPLAPAGRIFGPLIAQQLRTMVVTFDGQTMHAQSPTLNVSRPYTLENVASFVFDVVSPDPQGAGPVRSRCQISDDGRRIDFDAQTDPWTGRGMIERTGP
jgi:hypothetical protein